MLKNKRWTAASAILAELAIGGCQYLGPRMTEQLDLPRNLEVEKVRREDAEAKPDIIKGTESLKKAEIYPSSGPVLGTVQGRERPVGKEGRYTLNFDDADVGEVAKAVLGDILKSNYVINPKVTGKVSLQTARPLTEEELIPTLEMVLRTNGAVLIGHKGLYRIEPDANAVIEAPSSGLSGANLPAGYQLRVIPLRFVSVQDMQKVIEPLMPPKSIIRADNLRNLLLVAGTTEELEGVMDAVRLFDVDFMRGMAVGLFPLKNVDATTVAEELTKLFGTDASGGALGGMLRLLPIERLNAILAVSPQSRYLNQVDDWVERLDRYNTAKAGGVHVVRIENVDAAELADTLSGIFGQGGGAGGSRPSVAPGFGGSEIGGGGSGGGSFGRSSSSGGFGSGSGGFGSSGGGSGGFGSGSSTGSTGGLGSSGGTGTGTGTGSSSLGGGGSSFGSGAGGGGGLGGGSSGSGGFGSSGGSGGGSFGSSSFGSSSASRSSSGSRGTAAADLGNNVRIVADISSNSLIIVAKAQEYKQIEEVIDRLDELPRQVMIDATIAEITLTGSLEYGLQWLINAGSQQATLTNSTAASIIDPLINNNVIAGGLTYYSVVSQGQNIRLLLRALAKQGKVNVLSSPSLMVLNNQQAQIKVGDQVPISTGSAVSTISANAPVVNSIQYRDTGVILTVRPRINSGGLVILEVEQAVDEPSSTTSSSIQSPTILQRQIKSTVAVKDRETLALGGLIRDKRSQDINGVPWLSTIPIIGPLFGTTARSLNRTELVVLLTPRVVGSAGQSRALTNEFRRSLKGLYKSPGVYNPGVAPELDSTQE